MFDIGADELLLTAVVAIVVIGPKDMPRALRTAGRWIAKMRRMSNAFRAGIDNVVREAELEEMEAEWRKQNAAIMAAHPPTTVEADALGAASAAAGHPVVLPPPATGEAGAEPLTGYDPPAAEAWTPPAPKPVPMAAPASSAVPTPGESGKPGA